MKKKVKERQKEIHWHVRLRTSCQNILINSNDMFHISSTFFFCLHSNSTNCLHTRSLSDYQKRYLWFPRCLFIRIFLTSHENIFSLFNRLGVSALHACNDWIVDVHIRSLYFIVSLPSLDYQIDRKEKKEPTDINMLTFKRKSTKKKFRSTLDLAS